MSNAGPTFGEWLGGHGSLARQMVRGLPRPAEGPWAEGGAGEPLPVLFYSQVAWDDVWQRPQELARGLARHRPVLFCSPVQIHQTGGALRGRWEPLRTEADGRLVVACPQILSGEYRSAAVRRLNRAIVARSLRPLLAGREYLFLTNSPFVAGLMEALRPARVAYDIMDDFCAFTWAPREGRRSEQAILRRADTVTAGTQSLADAYRAQAPGIEYLASGVDVAKLTRPQTEPEELRGLPRPRLLYVGTLNDRVSGELMAQVARAMPGASVVLVGPRGAAFGSPDLPGNVRELGLKPHDALAGYYQHCDVGLMPFADNAAARAVNPIKTLEYLACGLPVICTPVPEDVKRFFVPPVVLAEEGDWPARIREMLDSDTEQQKNERRAFAQGRSWDKLVERMEEKIGEL